MRRSLLFLSLAVLAPAEVPAAPVDFNREIRPILSKNCYGCHGPDEGSRMANLRLDKRDSATGGDGGHAAIVPGDSAASRMTVRISP